MSPPTLSLSPPKTLPSPAPSWESRVATYIRTVDRNPWLRHRTPHPKQRAFLLLDAEREVLYGGAARGGKSDALLMAAAQYLHVPGYAALLLRRNFTHLVQPDGLIPRSMEWWAGTGANWNGTERQWTFPCPGGGSAVIRFGYCDSVNDVYQYQGSQYAFVGWDELTHFAEQQYLYLFSRQSQPESGPLAAVPLRMRAGSNPGGVGHQWVKDRFVDPQTRKPGALFVPARVADNLSVNQSSYVASLSCLDPLTRAQLLAGDWNAAAGGRFKREWFGGCRRDPASPDFRVLYRDGREVERFKLTGRPVFQTCDPAASVSNAADYFVLTTWCLTPKANVVPVACHRDKHEIQEQVAVCQDHYRRWKPSLIAVEEVLNQRALAQMLRRSTTPPMVVRSVSPAGRKKLERAFGYINLVASGRVYLPEDDPTFPREDWLAEHVRFTGIEDEDANDDIVDTGSYAAELLPTLEAATGGRAPSTWSPGGGR